MARFMSSLLPLVLLAVSVSANSVFSSVSVNGVFQGQGVGVRVPTSNAPITDLASPDIICNTNFTQPVSQIVISVPAGTSVSAEFHRTSAGYTGIDPGSPLDPTDKGPVLAYLAEVPSATQLDVTGLEWFKIFEDGYDTTTHQWGSDKLYIANGSATFTIPSCLKSGQYLLRAEYIGLENAYTYPGAEFFLSCAQIEITGGGDASPDTVAFPGAYTSLSPGVIASIYGVTSYTPPGPEVFTC